jgi:hypothetical protein
MFYHIGGSRIALPGLLLASLLLNTILLLKPPAAASRSGTSKTPNSQVKQRSAAVHGSTRDLSRCRLQLRLQQLRANHQTRQLLAAARPSPAPSVGDGEPAVDDEDPRGSGFAAQRDMLCALGVEELRRNWKHGKDLIHDNLARDLGSRRAQSRDMNRTVNAFGDTLHLSSLQRSQLEKRYGPLRNRRVDAALEALRSDPPDYLAAFDEALDLYQDTDELVDQMYGTQAVESVRTTELRRRTRVLAVLASLADVSWDRSIEW